MEERFRNLMDEGDETVGVKEAKIQKVTFLLRDCMYFVKYFEPRVASLGPIHHGNPKYQLREKFKLILVRQFVQDCGKGINVLYEVEKARKSSN